MHNRTILHTHTPSPAATCPTRHTSAQRTRTCRNWKTSCLVSCQSCGRAWNGSTQEGTCCDETMQKSSLFEQYCPHAYRSRHVLGVVSERSAVLVLSSVDGGLTHVRQLLNRASCLLLEQFSTMKWFNVIRYCRFALT